MSDAPQTPETTPPASAVIGLATAQQPTTERSATRSAPRAGASRRPRSRAASVRRPKAVARARRTPQAATIDPLRGVLPPLFDTRHGERKFLTRLGTMGWRAESRVVAVSEVYGFADWLAEYASTGPTDVRAVTPRVITDYRDHLFSAGLSVSTVRLALVCLRLYYDFITGATDGAENPARHIPLPDRDLPELTPYTTAEAAAIFDTVTGAAWRAWDAGDTAAWLEAERDHAMLSMLYHSGIRRGELRRLRRRDLDLSAAEMRIKGKGEKARTITIPQALVETLERYLRVVRGTTDPNAFVFCELDRATTTWVTAGADADRATHRYLTPELEEQARAEDPDYGLGPYTLAHRANLHARHAGIDGHNFPHRWRHTFAGRCAEAGMPLEDIAKYLGHSIGKRQAGLGWNPITLDYIHLADDHLHRVVQAALPDPLPA